MSINLNSPSSASSQPNKLMTPNWNKNPIFDFRSRNDVPNALQTNAGQLMIDKIEDNAKITSAFSGGFIGAIIGMMPSLLLLERNRTAAAAATVAGATIAGAAINYAISPKIARNNAVIQLAQAELGLHYQPSLNVNRDNSSNSALANAATFAAADLAINSGKNTKAY